MGKVKQVEQELQELLAIEPTTEDEYEELYVKMKAHIRANPISLNSRDLSTWIKKHQARLVKRLGRDHGIR